VTDALDNRVLIAEAKIARQREEIARLKARGRDTTEAASLLSAMWYSLRLLWQHQRRAPRSGTPASKRPTVSAAPRDDKTGRSFGPPKSI
jgi:hypothetical protein